MDTLYIVTLVLLVIVYDSKEWTCERFYFAQSEGEVRDAILHQHFRRLKGI